MSLWEFNACAAAFSDPKEREGNGGSGDMSEERMRELGIDGFNGT